MGVALLVQYKKIRVDFSGFQAARKYGINGPVLSPRRNELPGNGLPVRSPVLYFLERPVYVLYLPGLRQSARRTVQDRPLRAEPRIIDGMGRVHTREAGSRPVDTGQSLRLPCEGRLLHGREYGGFQFGIPDARKGFLFRDVQARRTPGVIRRAGKLQRGEPCAHYRSGEERRPEVVCRKALFPPFRFAREQRGEEIALHFFQKLPDSAVESHPFPESVEGRAARNPVHILRKAHGACELCHGSTDQRPEQYAEPLAGLFRKYVHISVGQPFVCPYKSGCRQFGHRAVIPDAVLFRRAFKVIIVRCSLQWQHFPGFGSHAGYGPDTLCHPLFYAALQEFSGHSPPDGRHTAYPARQTELRHERGAVRQPFTDFRSACLAAAQRKVVVYPLLQSFEPKYVLLRFGQFFSPVRLVEGPGLQQVFENRRITCREKILRRQVIFYPAPQSGRLIAFVPVFRRLAVQLSENALCHYREVGILAALRHFRHPVDSCFGQCPDRSAAYGLCYPLFRLPDSAVGPFENPRNLTPQVLP